ncbi:SpoIIE family protein phosphatase, partial [candidate division KSB1 bacterium]|nr:SpoIIE family protein phosphatase [candidate division KSB1 bacterium]
MVQNLKATAGQILQESLTRSFKIAVVILGVTMSLAFGRLPQNLDFTFEQIFLEQGLSQSIVQCIFQDRQGCMWFGTEDGLNQYDGYRFTVIRHDPEQTNSLSYNNITTLCEDRTGIFWIGTFYGGLNRYDPRTRHYTRYRFDANDASSLSNDNINAIFEDRDGNIWIGTDCGLNKLVFPDPADATSVRFNRFMHHPNHPNSLSHNRVHAIGADRAGNLWIGTENGLNQMTPGKTGAAIPTIQRYQHATHNPYSLGHNEVFSLLEDKFGTLWVGTREGLDRFDRNTHKFSHYRHDPKNPHSLSHNQVFVLYETRAGLLWIGTNGGGVNLFDRENERFISYRHDPFNPATISYDEIRAIYEDRSGLIWIGTYGGGIEKVDQSKRQFVLYAPELKNPNSLSHPIVWAIHTDRNGMLWIGTHGGGLNRFDRRTNRWKHYRHDPNNPNSLSHDIVRVIFEDQAGIFWLGTHGGGVDQFDPFREKFVHFTHRPNDPTSLSANEIRTIFQDRAGVIWIGTYGQGLNQMVPSHQSNLPPTFRHYRNNPNDAQSLSNDFVRVIFEDRAGNFWIGTEGGGLNKFDRKSQTCTRYRANPNVPHSLYNDYIFTIHEDQSGCLWLGTWGGGLNKFDPASGIFSHFTEKDGLPNDAIYGILEDTAGNFWLSTNNGLSKFNPWTQKFKNYSIEDGLQSNEFNGGAYHQSRQGEMFFGGIEGFNAFFPAEIKDNPFIPPIIITTFSKLNQAVQLNQPLSEIKELRLSYRDYFFSFEFAALDFTAPENNLYAYKMEGLDPDWIYTSSKKRFATYTTLASGSYTFRVKGSNNDGVWNETGAAIKIVITPPIWQTWWFRSLITLLILGIIFQFYRRRSKNIQIKTELQAAHAAQMSIMPQADPVVAGFDISGSCIPANTVGGDFFDYFWLNQEKTKFGIAIGDVSGKAMKSAMTAVMTNGMIYATVVESDLAIKAIMTSLNRPLYLKTDKTMFTALCLAVINLSTREL